MKIRPKDRLKLSLGAKEEKGQWKRQWEPVISLSTGGRSAQERMLRTDLVVQEMVKRLERGEGIKRIAPELAVDPKTVKRSLKLGRWQPQRRA